MITFVRLADATTLIVAHDGHEYPLMISSDGGDRFYDDAADQPAVPEHVLDLIDDADERGDVQAAIDRLLVDLVDDSYVTLHGYRESIP